MRSYSLRVLPQLQYIVNLRMERIDGAALLFQITKGAYHYDRY